MKSPARTDQWNEEATRENSMTDVSIIGLGPMGGALARVLVQGGKSLTVWNRSRERAAPFVDAGARLASSVADAVRASPVVLVCVLDYATTDVLLRSPDVAPLLAGKRVVQLSTGSPREAREAQAWMHERGASYIDGAILAVPSQMGTPMSTLLVSGEEPAYRAVESTLRLLVGRVLYVGAQVGTAAALDLGVLSHMYGALFGFYHGVRIVEAERTDVAELGTLIHEIAPALAEMVKHEADVLRERRFAQPESTLGSSARVLRMMVSQAREAQIDASFPTFASALFERALHAGYGDEALAALVKVMHPT